MPTPMKQATRPRFKPRCFQLQNLNLTASLCLASVANTSSPFPVSWHFYLVPQLTWAVIKEVPRSPHTIPWCAEVSWLQTFHSDKGQWGPGPPPTLAPPKSASVNLDKARSQSEKGTSDAKRSFPRHTAHSQSFLTLRNVRAYQTNFFKNGRKGV